MDIKQLKSLVAIAENGTFAKAAEKCNLTASAISQQIQHLEIELKTELFDRTSRPPILNTKGLHLLETAHKILQLIDETTSSIIGNELNGILNIGTIRTSTIGILPKAIVDLRNDLPLLKTKIHVGLSELLINDVAARRLDFAVVAKHIRIPTSLQWNPFIREPLVIIAKRDNNVMNQNEILKNKPYVRFNSNVPLANLINTEIARMGIETKDITEIDTIPAIIECVYAGLGASVVPVNAVNNQIKDTLVVLPFGEPLVFRELGIVQRFDSQSKLVNMMIHTRLVKFAGKYGYTNLKS